MWRRQPCASIEAKECMTRTADRARGDPPRITRVGKTWRAHESLFVLPRGRRDFFVQLAIWLGFAFGYQVARGLADRGTGEALTHARWIFHLEQRLDAFFEPDLQRRVLQAGGLLLHAVNWTYWLSQLAVVGLALLWIYLRHNAAYPRVRDALIVTNTIGLLIYVVLPTAPPRLLPGIGIQDTISQAEVVSHHGVLVKLAANPFAAMPSLHAADALIIGLALAAVARPVLLKAAFLLWPVWVSFSLIATGNHFWLDIAAGLLLATAGFLAAGRLEPPATVAARRVVASGPLGA